MRKNFTNKFAAFLLLGAFLVTSCKTTQKVVEPAGPVTLAPQAADTLFEKMLASQFRYTWLTAKASVEYVNSNNESTEFSANVRMLKDSVIWLSVTPLLGIEVARAVITRDSIRLLDRLHNVYIARDYGYLEDMLKTRVTFEMLQALLTGNYFAGVPGRDIQSVYTEPPHYILSTLLKLKELRGMEEKNPDHPVVQDVWVDTTNRIAKNRVLDDTLHRQLTLEYSDFASLSEGRLPQHIVLSVESVKPTRIAMRYSKFSFHGPLTFPFSVPDSFSRE